MAAPSKENCPVRSNYESSDELIMGMLYRKPWPGDARRDLIAQLLWAISLLAAAMAIVPR
jgi:hypothetical protein